MEIEKTAGDRRRLSGREFWKKSGRVCLLAFAVPFVIMCIAFAALEIYPFGDQQVLVYDAWHQYYPFFVELHRKIRGGESLLYCWRLGMGNGFVSLMSYYLASPLNLLLVFVPFSMLKEAFALFILLKIGAAGLFCSYSINKINEGSGENNFGYASVIFSTLYALCSWMIGYYWNIMWLDTFAVFPLAALGIFMLVKEKKYKLYIISLTIAIFTNYYIGVMVCIFTALYFFAQCLIQKNRFRDMLLNLRNIIVCSAISIMSSAVVLIPTVITLQSVFKNENGPEKWEVSRGWIETLANTFAYLKATYYNGLPNLYCGVACIIFLIAFYRLSSVSRREKIVYSILILFFFISTNVNMLDYAWHGFHSTNSLPYRFTFMCSFLLVMLAYRTYCALDRLRRKDWVILCIVSALYFLAVAVEKIDQYKKDYNFDSVFEALKSDQVELVPFLFKNFLVIAAYLVLILLFVERKLNRKVFTLLLAAAAAAELVPTVLSGTQAVQKTDRNSYPDKYEEIQGVLSHIKTEETGNDFYRMELAEYYNLNDPLLYGFNGLATFTSTVPEAITDIFENLGLSAWQAGNRYYYQNATPVDNAFLNLKYLISKDGGVANEEYLTEICREGEVYAYRNEAYLPIGFMVESGLADFKFDGDTPFEKQNNLIKAAAGIDEDVFDALDIIHVSHQNLEVDKYGYGFYNYRQAADADLSANEVYQNNYEMPKDGCAYVYMDLSESNEASVLFNGEEAVYDIRRAGIFPAGTYREGDIFSVKSQLEPGKSGTLYIYVSVLNQDVFDQAYEMLRDETLELQEYTSRSLKGTVTAKKDGLLYTSIPFEEGWDVYVDGAKAEITLIDDAFISVFLKGGTHTVEFKYAPSHVYLAAAVSLLGIAAFAILIVLEKKKIFHL